MTDAKGEYTVEGLRPGQYRLLVRSPGYRQNFSATVELDNELKTRVELPLPLERGAKLEVQVTDDAGPVADAQIQIVDAAGSVVNMGLSIETDASGVYRFASLEPSAHVIRVISERHQPVTAQCTLTLEQLNVVKITATRKTP
jgi:protocatechuate 3,4-dioxygenase beta subunit